MLEPAGAAETPRRGLGWKGRLACLGIAIALGGGAFLAQRARQAAQSFTDRALVATGKVTGGSYTSHVTIDPVSHDVTEDEEIWLEYAFDVSGNAYEGRSDATKDLFLGHKVGSSIEVFYDPVSPGENALSRTPDSSGGRFLLAFLALGIAFLAAAILPFPRRRKPS